MPFSKFDPNRPVEPARGIDASTPSAARRVWILKWVWRIVLVYTMVGFGFMAYWLTRRH